MLRKLLVVALVLGFVASAVPMVQAAEKQQCPAGLDCSRSLYPEDTMVAVKVGKNPDLLDLAFAYNACPWGLICPRQHPWYRIVRPGDTLWEIADRYLDSGFDWHRLCWVDRFGRHPDLGGDPRLLDVGSSVGFC